MTPLDRFNAIFDVLVQYAGALASDREYFVARHLHWAAKGTEPTEFRFMGSLGMGGKLYGNSAGFHVDAYAEDIVAKPKRKLTIRVTNEALKQFKSEEIHAASEPKTA